eukprot:4843478-Prymnesium_polylepis.1
MTPGHGGRGPGRTPPCDVPLFPALDGGGPQTEPAAARSRRTPVSPRGALERYAFCRLLGEGD